MTAIPRSVLTNEQRDILRASLSEDPKNRACIAVNLTEHAATSPTDFKPELIIRYQGLDKRLLAMPIEMAGSWDEQYNRLMTVLAEVIALQAKAQEANNSDPNTALLINLNKDEAREVMNKAMVLFSRAEGGGTPDPVGEDYKKLADGARSESSLMDINTRNLAAAKAALFETELVDGARFSASFRIGIKPRIILLSEQAIPGQVLEAMRDHPMSSEEAKEDFASPRISMGFKKTDFRPSLAERQMPYLDDYRWVEGQGRTQISEFITEKGILKTVNDFIENNFAEALVDLDSSEPDQKRKVFKALLVLMGDNQPEEVKFNHDLEDAKEVLKNSLLLKKYSEEDPIESVAELVSFAQNGDPIALKLLEIIGLRMAEAINVEAESELSNYEGILAMPNEGVGAIFKLDTVWENFTSELKEKFPKVEAKLRSTRDNLLAVSKNFFEMLSQEV